MRHNRFYLIIVCILVIAAFITGGTFFLKSKYVAPILMYHSIDERCRQTKLSVCPRSFERQMAFLHEHSYNVVALKALVDMIKNNTPLPPKTVAITFDDGYENNYVCAFPALKKYKIPATIFVIINNIGKEGYLSRNQIKEMVESGLVSIGSHTLSHAYLPSVSDREGLHKEIFQSKKIIERMTNQKDIFFSYPVGGFNDRIRMLVKQAGYAGACATNPGRLYTNNDIYALKRVRISRTSDNMVVFWIESSGYYTFIKEIRDEE